MNRNRNRNRCVSIGVVGLALLLQAGCAQQARFEPRQDPLIGQIIDSASQQSISFDQLVERAAQVDVVYLGERHDNAEHHQNQLTVVQALIDQGKRPVLGFEFFDITQSGYLMQYVAGKKSMMQLHSPAKASPPGERLRKQLGWSERSDSDWNYYFQLIELARLHQLPVFGADLPAGIRLRLSRTEAQQLTAVEQQQLSLQTLADDDYKTYMFEQFTAGHCGWSSEPLMTRLYRTWYERNYRMASSVVAMAQTPEGAGEDSPSAGPVVMILGAGHTEHNQAVVAQVAKLAPQLTQLNIGLQEIYIEQAPLADYLNGHSVDQDGGLKHDFGPRYDLLWFTQRQDYRDRCAELNKPK